MVDEDFFVDGKMFDGSSIAGWKGINESDMILMPDPSTAMIDPFFEETTLLLRCDVVEPTTMQGYSRDPRSLGEARGSLPQVHGHRRDLPVRSRERILHLRQRALDQRDQRLQLSHRFRAGRLELRHDL